MLPLVCALLAFPYSHVHGTFRGSVRIPLLPTQHIQVSTARFDAHKAHITLRGYVNLKEDVYVLRDDAADRWDFEFGDGMRQVLKKYSCRIYSVSLEEARVTVCLKLPLIGRYTIVLDRDTVVSSRDII